MGRRRGPPTALGLAAVAVAVVLAGCADLLPRSTIDVRGSVYTDFLSDRPCDVDQAPDELAQIALTFRAGDGRDLWSTRTAAIESEPLPPRPGTEAWEHHGCRYRAPYSVTLPVAPEYRVDFTVPPAPARGAYWNGAQHLTTQTITREELEARNFEWTFETPAEFVVP